jgi:cytochrome P450
MHGCPMHEGDKVMILWGSANRDEAQFPNADDIVLDRTPNRHVGFGMGPHRCVGSHLAKVVMQTVLERLVPTLPEWELLDPAAVHWEGSEVRGIRRLDLVRKSARE